MLSKSFKAGKCKTSLKLAAARIKLLKNKREVQVKHMRQELAQLLEAGQDQTARIRVEHVIREEKTMSAYDLIELYCELIVARLSIIESQKSCPIDLKEAITSVVFASPRCADIPELMDIRKHFVAKYGKEFVNSALEVRPNCGVNRLVVEKLSARAPDIETKIKILKAVAQEYSVNWDSKAFEDQLQKPNDDLLNGPNTFDSTSKMHMESSNIKPSSASAETTESSTKMFQSQASTNATNFTASSHDDRIPSVSVPSTSQAMSRASDSRYGGESKNSDPRDESLNRPNWNMEFKDATSAAQAAAESAERASMAARAAAEFAIRGNMPTQSSTGSNEYFTYGMKDERLDRSDPRVKGEDIVKESVKKANYERKSSRGMKPEMQKPQKDEAGQGVPRRGEQSTYDDYSSSRRSSRNPSFRSSETYVNDGLEDYGRAQKTLPESQALRQDHKNMEKVNVESNEENVNVFSKSASSHYATTSDEGSIWDSKVHKHENDEAETSTVGVGEGFFQSGHKQSISSVYSSAVVFDDYGSDTDDSNSVFGRNKGDILDSFSSSQVHERSNLSSNIGLSNPKQLQSGSKPELYTESYPDERKVTLPSQADDSLPSAFDDSDGLSTECEDEVDNSSHSEALKSTGFAAPLSSDNILKRSGPSNLVDNLPSPKYDRVPSNLKDSERGYDRVPINLKDSEKGYDGVPSNLKDAERGSGSSSTDEEELQPLHLPGAQPMKKTEAKDVELPLSPGSRFSEVSDEFGQESGHGLNFGRLTGGFKNRGFRRPPYISSSRHSTEDTSDMMARPVVSRKAETSDDLDVPAQESLTQRSRREVHKELSSNSRGTPSDLDGNGEPSYTLDTRGNSGSASASLKQRADASPDIDMSSSSHSSKTLASSEVLNRDRYDNKSRMKTFRESSSRTPITYSDSDDDEPELDLHYTARSRVNADVKHSRRTRDVPSKTKNSSFSRFTGPSDVLLTSELESKPSIMRSAAPEPPSKITHDAVDIQRRSSATPVVQTTSIDESPKSSQLNSSESAVQGNGGNAKAAGSIMRESSFKNASHTHPKLPDYETLAAHFQSLRSNRR